MINAINITGNLNNRLIAISHITHSNHNIVQCRVNNKECNISGRFKVFIAGIIGNNNIMSSIKDRQS